MTATKPKQAPAEKQVDKLLALHAQRVQIKAFYLPLHQLCADYFCPNRNNVYKTRLAGEKKGTKIYDGSPIMARKIWADGLQGYLVGQAIRWFLLKLAQDWLMDIEDVKLWLQEVEQILYTHFARSNFYAELGMFFDDGGWNGNPTLYSEWNFKSERLVFHTADPSEITYSLNDEGTADCVDRQFKMTARQALRRFGKEKLSKSILDSVNRNRFEDEFEFVHMVYPNDQFDPDRIGNRFNAFSEVFIAQKDRHICYEGGYRTLNPLIWPVRRYSGEIYARSPGMDALVEALKLNAYVKSNTMAANLLADPSYLVHPEFKEKGRPIPGKLYYSDDPQTKTIKPIQSGIELPAAVDREERVQAAVERHFNIDFFLMLNRSQTREKTAYEVMKLEGEQAVLMGPQVGSLTRFLDGVIDRVFDLLRWANKIPTPPAVLLESETERLDIDYIGPLAQAQRRHFKMQGLEAGLEITAPLREQYEEANDVINVDVTTEELLEAAGFPAKAINPKKVRQQMRQQRAQARQAEATMAMAQAGADAAGKLTKSAEAGSPLEAMLAGANETL